MRITVSNRIVLYKRTNQKAEVKFFPSSHKANRYSQEDEGAFIIVNVFNPIQQLQDVIILKMRPA